MRMACVASWGYDDVQAHAAVERHANVYGPPTARVCVDVCGPFYYRGPCRLVPVGHAPTTVRMIFLAFAAAQSHAGICGAGCL